MIYHRYGRWPRDWLAVDLCRLRKLPHRSPLSIIGEQRPIEEVWLVVGL
jgi:hypothetical protein